MTPEGKHTLVQLSGVQNIVTNKVKDLVKD